MKKIVLDAVFGKDSTGRTAKARAKNSERVWVRSQDQLAVCTNGATGMKLSSQEALEIFGMVVLEEAVDKSSAIIVRDLSEPAGSLRRRRQRMRLSVEDMVNRTGLDESVIYDAEDPDKRSSIWDLHKICQVLEIDTKRLGWERFE